MKDFQAFTGQLDIQDFRKPRFKGLPHNSLDLVYKVEFSDSLNTGDWIIARDPGTVMEIDSHWERVEVQDLDGTIYDQTRFGRVRIDYIEIP